MREIKFRAFGKNSKEFLCDKTGCGLSLIEIQNIESIGDWEFSQFTGLHDKNGKEIYEGDIIRVIEIDYESVDEKSGKFGKKLVDKIAVVEWKSIGWGFRIENNMWLYDGYRNFEVIGNIYQNPELLANKQKS